MLGRGCTGITVDGRRCNATRLRDEPFCFWHAPDREEDAAEARRLGGLRRKREKTLAGVYELSGLDNVAAIRRILEIATIDALGLENSIARARVLISAAMAAAKLLEVGELEARLAVLEALAKDRPAPPAAGSGLLHRTEL